MKRYIDPEKIRLISDFAYDGDFDILVPLPDVIKAVNMTPSEDVAPRAEVAKEIFGEIEEGIKAAVSALQFENNPIHRKVRHEVYSGVMRFIKIVEEKYTEGANDE